MGDGHSILDQPLVSFGREICSDLPSALHREWLVTNGLGGYASSTVAGVNTRRYHGLLVAALQPPVKRTVLVGGLIEWATYEGQWFPLSTHEYGDGVIDPPGYQHLESFALNGLIPVWRYALADAVLERRVWMAHRANTAYVMYTVVRAEGAVHLDVSPLVTYRDFHVLSSGHGWQPGVERVPNGAVIRAHEDARPFRLLSDGASFVPGGGDWYWNFWHRAESFRGLDDRSDLFTCGAFTAELPPGQSLTLVFTTEEDARLEGQQELAAERRRQGALVESAGAAKEEPALQQLVLGADQFLVRRRHPDGNETGAVIAGYHWFNDWGRDTMIALPGLTLATGRPAEAAEILRAFASYVRDGLLPNSFPDTTDEPEYGTVDASLWYILAVREYVGATGDTALVDELLPVLREIAAQYRRGTHFGIGVDLQDGLLRAGEPGDHVTWMDAKVGGWAVTPRTGKPVEVNALWYNALCALAELSAARDEAAAREYGAEAERVKSSFRARFLREGQPHLADVVDGPDGDDVSHRPNQVLALSLPYPLLEPADAARVLAAIGRRLFTDVGLRSLSPEEDGYQGSYNGEPQKRDHSYHQGPAWTWLAGPYAEADFLVHGDAGRALSILEPFRHHLLDAGLGSISEIVDGDPPHKPRGAIAQAWGVAALLRAWRKLAALATEHQGES